MGFEFEYPDGVYEAAGNKNKGVVLLRKGDPGMYEISAVVLKEKEVRKIRKDKPDSIEEITVGGQKTKRRYFEDGHFGKLAEVRLRIGRGLWLQLVLVGTDNLEKAKRFDELLESFKLINGRA